MGIFARGLFEQRLALLRNYQNAAVSMLELIPYPLSYFQILPAPQTGISQTHPDSPQPSVEISQMQPDGLQPPPGISQIQSEKPHQPVGISQLQLDSPQPQTGISQKLVDISLVQVGVSWDIPSEYPFEESNISLNREDQELLRLWTNGLTAKEIGMRTGKTGKTISNRLSVLRGMYGEERIPLRKAPTRKGLG